MLIKNIAIACLFVCLLMVGAPLRAAPINDEGAARLKSIFETILSDQAKMLSAKGKTTLEREGEVLVEQADTYYAVTLPYLQVAYQDGSKLKIGIISVNALPHESSTPEDDQWKMTLALPTPMTMYNKDNKPVSRVSIEGQKAAGIFHGNVQQFSKLDAKYENIKIESAKAGGETMISNVIARFNFDQDAKGLWSGPGYIELNNLKSRQSNGLQVASIGNIKGSYTMDQWDPKAGRAYQTRYIALQDKGAFQSRSLAPADAKELSTALLDLFTKGMNGINATFSIADVTLTKPAPLKAQTLEDTPEEPAQDKNLKIADAAITFGMNGLLNDSVALGLNVKYNGLEVSPLAEEDKDIAPSKLNMDIQIKNIPFKQLLEMGQNTMAAAGDNPQQALQLAGITLMMKLPAILSQAGTSIELNNNNVGNALYNVDLNGSIIADIAAANSATAKATMVFQGLDALLTKTKAVSLNPENPNSEKMQKLSQRLEFLKSIPGAQNGSETYTYDFVLDAQGQMLLNGQDMKTLMGQPQIQEQEQIPATPPQ